MLTDRTTACADNSQSNRTSNATLNPRSTVDRSLRRMSWNKQQQNEILLPDCHCGIVCMSMGGCARIFLIPTLLHPQSPHRIELTVRTNERANHQLGLPPRSARPPAAFGTPLPSSSTDARSVPFARSPPIYLSLSHSHQAPYTSLRAEARSTIYLHSTCILQTARSIVALHNSTAALVGRSTFVVIISTTIAIIIRSFSLPTLAIAQHRCWVGQAASRRAGRQQRIYNNSIRRTNNNPMDWNCGTANGNNNNNDIISSSSSTIYYYSNLPSLQPCPFFFTVFPLLPPP